MNTRKPFLLLLFLLVPQAAPAVEFYNGSNTNLCIGRSGLLVKGLTCSTTEATFMDFEWVGGRRLKFTGTNLCVEADSPNTTIVATCRANDVQRWVLTGTEFSNVFYGAGRLLYYDAASGRILLKDTCKTHPTRQWFSRCMFGFC